LGQQNGGVVGDDHEADWRVTDGDLRQLVDYAVNPFIIIDHLGTVLWAGESIEELLGLTAAEIAGTSMLDYLAPESIDDALASLAAAREYVSDRTHTGAQGWDGVGPIMHIRGREGLRVTCSIAVATPARTGLPGFVLQLRRAGANFALENALVAMAEGRPMPEVMQQVAGMLQNELPQAEVAVFWRHGAEPLQPVAGPDALSGLLLSNGWVAGTPWQRAFDEPAQVVEAEVEELPSPLRGVAAAHGHRWLSLYVLPSLDLGPAPAVIAIWSGFEHPMHIFTHQRVHRCSALVALVVQWERGQRALHWEATHDELTALHNRAYFLGELTALDRRGEQAAVLYLDLDDFKPVNDEHGHNVGDRVLVEVAARLQRSVRPDDVVARLGGDEFAVLCRGVHAEDSAEALAERLVAEVTLPMVVDGYAVQVGLSVGLAPVLPDDGAEDVLVRADAALRTAKVDGKQRWRRFDDPSPMDPAVLTSADHIAVPKPSISGCADQIDLATAERARTAGDQRTEEMPQVG
jgi:diguanylate cyclase (GGDEF)-like protein